ncbi:hypothetical protein [Flexithrix dorotheae]|uniref:hypothetical protein n=1 Tax=Flexithrix dorotheae TaxID=70993 RepID=UPI00146A46E1|nr:hypothetical protein [Flexithrix dorotheae]
MIRKTQNEKINQELTFSGRFRKIMIEMPKHIIRIICWSHVRIDGRPTIYLSIYSIGINVKMKGTQNSKLLLLLKIKVKAESIMRIQMANNM